MKLREKRLMALIMVVCVFLGSSLTLMQAPSPPRPALATEGGESGPEERGEAEEQKVPTIFRANLSSPPMFVDAWNVFNEEDEAGMMVLNNITRTEGEYAEASTRLQMWYDDVESYWTGFGGQWVYVCEYDWKYEAVASTWAEHGSEAYAYLRGEGHTKEEEGCYYEDTLELLLVGSFYLPRAINATVSVSLSYRFEAEIAYGVNFHVMTFYARAGARILIFTYVIDEDLWCIFLGPGYTLTHPLDVCASRTEPPYAVGYLEKGSVPSSDYGMEELTFQIPHDLVEHGNVWIGVGVVLLTEAYTNCTALATEGAQTVAEARAYLKDIRVEAVYEKKAFTLEEMGYIDMENHTAWLTAEGPAHHTIKYGVGYSRTWDEFKFSIYVPDYADTLLEGPIETGHVDGLLTGTFNTTSPNYMYRLLGLILSLSTAKMGAQADFYRINGGESWLHLYEVIEDEVTRQIDMEMRVHGPRWAHAIVEDWVKCHAWIRVRDENLNPIEGAYVEVYDGSGQLVATGYTDRMGYLLVDLPHQGIYHFFAYYGDEVGYRISSILPIMSADYVGPYPDWPDKGYLEVGFKRTGKPGGPPYNTVEIVLGSEASLFIEAIVLVPPLPYAMKWAKVNVTVLDENYTILAEGITPFNVSLSKGTYVLQAPETVLINGSEYRFIAWLFVDKGVVSTTSRVDVSMDRHVYAIYAQGFKLNITSLLSNGDMFANAVVLIIDEASTVVLDTPMGKIGVPRVVWNGITPFTAILPAGNYTLIAYEYEPDNYVLYGWLGVDEELGQARVPLLDVNLVGAKVNLTSDREVSCLHELEEGDPLLIVRSKFLDGTPVVGVPLKVMSTTYYYTHTGFYVETETPYEDYRYGSFVLEVPLVTEAGWVLHHWEGADWSLNNTAYVECYEGKLVWAVYTRTQPDLAGELGPTLASRLGARCSLEAQAAQLQLAPSSLPTWLAAPALGSLYQAPLGRRG